MPCVVESRAARLLKEMLTNVLLNDLCLSHEQRVEWPFDALVEVLFKNTFLVYVYVLKKADFNHKKIFATKSFFRSFGLAPFTIK